jgi:hypothetical protein
MSTAYVPWVRKGVPDWVAKHCLRTMGAQWSIKIGKISVAYTPRVRKGSSEWLDEHCLRTVSA